MNFAHMAIALSTSRKGFHAEPAYVSVASLARHLVAAVRLFDRRPAVWAIPNVILALPLFKGYVSTLDKVLVLFAGVLIVVDSLASCADGR